MASHHCGFFNGSVMFFFNSPDKFLKCTTCEKCSNQVSVKWPLTTIKFEILLSIYWVGKTADLRQFKKGFYNCEFQSDICLMLCSNLSNSYEVKKNSERNQVLKGLYKDSALQTYKTIECVCCIFVRNRFLI